MNRRTRKLIGSVLLVAFVVVYALIVMTIAAARLPGTSVATQTIFYVVGGLLWVLPAGLLISWMQRP